jgi:ATP-dependent exoDNAse (exonuclease V) beta subunit
VTPLCRGGLTVSAEQATVVDHVLAHPFTVADAGAGKTRTTVATVFELLARRPDLTLDQFVLITFTNKAADELRGRLEAALGDLEAAASGAQRRRWAACRERLAGAYVGTIHGFCRQVLRTFGYGTLTARQSDVDFAGGLLHESIEETLEEDVLRQAAHPLRRTLGGKWRLHALHRLIREIHQDLRNGGLSPDAVAEATARQAADEGRPFRVALADAVRDAHRRYQGKKREGQKLDSADLLLRTAQVLEGADGPAIVAKLTQRYRYLFIDEFQDTDALQKRIVDRLAPKLEAGLVVGDAKQSIYGFRRAGLSLDDIARQ